MKNYEEIANSVFERKKQYETQKKRKRKILTATLIPLCCVCLIALSGFGAWRMGLFEPEPSETAADAVTPGTKDCYGPEEEIYDEIESEETALENDNVLIYCVAGDEILSEQVLLPLSPKNIFDAWKEKNGIGDDVEFISVSIDDNSTTTSEEINGQAIITHTMGDYFIYNLTISKEIENYYSQKNSELLLRSLEDTMKNYSSMEYDEYHLILE